MILYLFVIAAGFMAGFFAGNFIAPWVYRLIDAIKGTLTGSR